VARKKRKSGRFLRRALMAMVAVPTAYLLAALIGSIVPVNRGWVEPDRGITIYLADNGIHTDIIMPVKAAGLDWAPVVPRSHFATVDPSARYIAIGAGEEEVYLNTPRWVDIKPATIWSALAGGRRILHVEWVADPRYAARAIRLRPEEYRRLWQAVRADFGPRPDRIDHPGYGPADAFYRTDDKANAVRTCNQWTADRLRLAGIKAPLWSPFVWGLTTRYRDASAAN